MFEVGWCVMLYTTVLFLEFLPAALERFKLAGPLRVVARLSPVLVIVGVILSTLHQSSLGSLFLILPHKLHPLWYSPMLPVLFFLSSVAAGLAMTVVLASYFALRLRDLVGRGALGSLFPLTLASWLFLAELVPGVAAPMVLLALPWTRRSPKRLAVTQGLVVLGFILHRLNVSTTAIEAALGQRYVPAVREFLVTMGLVALGMSAFCAACKYLPVFPQRQFSPAHGRGEAPVLLAAADVVEK